MPIEFNGYNKLMEECGELIGITAKKASYPNTDKHPDGGSFWRFMEDEIGDVIAMIEYVTNRHALDQNRIMERARKKLQRHHQAFPKRTTDVQSTKEAVLYLHLSQR